MKLSAQQAAMIARDVVLGVEARKKRRWDFCGFYWGKSSFKMEKIHGYSPSKWPKNTMGFPFGMGLFSGASC